MSAKKHGEYSVGLYVYIHSSQSYGSIAHLQLHYSTVGVISRCCVIFLFVVISTKIHVSLKNQQSGMKVLNLLLTYGNTKEKCS
jgi:hypothetical protein